MVIEQVYQKNLSFCEIPGESARIHHFPDFLIIGPQRTGTTWLADNLRHHPEIFVSTPKELYYFNLLNNPDHFQFQSRDLLWYERHFHAPPLETLKRKIAEARYFKQCFRIRARGEATASYAADTDPRIIDEIASLNPNMKIILMLRNPIMRAWAHAKKDLANVSHLNESARAIDDIPDEEVIAFLNSPYQLACGQYSRIHQRWSERFGSRLFTGIFDDLSDNPTGLLLSVFQFLGVRAEQRFLTHRAGKKISPTDQGSGKRALPPRFERQLRERFADELEWVNDFAGRELRY